MKPTHYPRAFLLYASRLPGEPAQGVNDIHTHPAEPRSARLFVSYGF